MPAPHPQIAQRGYSRNQIRSDAPALPQSRWESVALKSQGTVDTQEFVSHQRFRTKSTMAWDAKRQLIWLAGGLTLGTLIAYQDAHDDDGTFVPRFFIFMESLVLIIIGVLFYLYSRKKG